MKKMIIWALIYVISNCFCNSDYELIEYKSNYDYSTSNYIYYDDQFHINLTYIYQDDTTYNFENKSSQRWKLIETELGFSGTINKKYFKLIDFYTELKKIEGGLIKYNKIILCEYHRKKNNKYLTFDNFNTLLVNDLTLNNDGEDISDSNFKKLGDIRIEYDVSKVPDKVMIYYRIKYLYNDVEYFKEDSFEIKKTFTEY